MLVSGIENLLNVQTQLDDVLPQRIFLKGKCRLERGTEDLWGFQVKLVLHVTMTVFLSAYGPFEMHNLRAWSTMRETSGYIIKQGCCLCQASFQILMGNLITDRLSKYGK